MVPPAPSPFHTIVFRGGAVQHVPAHMANEIMAAKVTGSTVSLQLPTGLQLIDTAEVGRVLPFVEWRRSEEPKLASMRKRICPFGTVHDDDEECRCHINGLVPMIEVTARAMVAMAQEFAALPEASAARADHKHHHWLPAAIENGYIGRVASTHKLPLSLQAPTHG